MASLGDGLVAVGHVATARVIFKTGVLTYECKSNTAYRAITLLGYDDFRRALVHAIRVIHFIAVDKQYHVGILLDRPGLAQIAHYRALVWALLHTAIEL